MARQSIERFYIIGQKKDYFIFHNIARKYDDDNNTSSLNNSFLNNSIEKYKQKVKNSLNESNISIKKKSSNNIDDYDTNEQKQSWFEKYFSCCARDKKTKDIQEKVKNDIDKYSSSNELKKSI